MAKPIFQLSRKHGAIASQDIHLDRSLYSLAFPIKTKDAVIVNTEKSYVVNEDKPNVPVSFIPLDVQIPFVFNNMTFSSVEEFHENFRLGAILTTLTNDIPYVFEGHSFTSKLEASINEVAPQLTSILNNIPFVFSGYTFTSNLNIITHRQKQELIEVNTLKSKYEVK